MSVGIPGSNPAYSLQSVLQAQLQGLSQPNPPSSSGSPTAAADPTIKATYNNLPVITPPHADQPSNDQPSDAGGASTLPAAPPAQPPGLDSANAAAGAAADLATSTTASTLTAGGSVSPQPYKGSAPGTQDIAVTAAPTQISSAILQGANTDAGHLSGLISQYA